MSERIKTTAELRAAILSQDRESPLIVEESAIGDDGTITQIGSVKGTKRRFRRTIYNSIKRGGDYHVEFIEGDEIISWVR